MPRRKLEQAKEPRRKKEKQEETKTVFCSVEYGATAFSVMSGQKPPPRPFKIIISSDAIDKIEDTGKSMLIHLLCSFETDFPAQVNVTQTDDGCSILEIRKKKKTNVIVKNTGEETLFKVTFSK